MDCAKSNEYNIMQTRSNMASTGPFKNMINTNVLLNIQVNAAQNDLKRSLTLLDICNICITNRYMGTRERRRDLSNIIMRDYKLQ